MVMMVPHNSGAGKSSIQNISPARKPCTAATAMVPKTVARMVVPIILNKPFVSWPHNGENRRMALNILFRSLKKKNKR